MVDLFCALWDDDDNYSEVNQQRKVILAILSQTELTRWISLYETFLLLQSVLLPSNLLVSALRASPVMYGDILVP